MIEEVCEHFAHGLFCCGHRDHSFFYVLWTSCPQIGCENLFLFCEGEKSNLDIRKFESLHRISV